MCEKNHVMQINKNAQYISGQTISKRKRFFSCWLIVCIVCHFWLWLCSCCLCLLLLQPHTTNNTTSTRKQARRSNLTHLAFKLFTINVVMCKTAADIHYQWKWQMKQQECTVWAPSTCLSSSALNLSRAGISRCCNSGVHRSNMSRLIGNFISCNTILQQ